MESPVSFGLKVEPASPLWGLELLEEVGEIWEGDVTVIEGSLDVDADVDVDNNAFWGQQDISELIGKEEQILGLELDEITLEDQELLDVKEEPFTSWLDSGAIYDGSNSTVTGLPTFNTPALWSPSPESPSEEKAAVFTIPAGGPAVPDPMQGPTADLFTEFEDVLTQAAGSLTPPDSPRSASAFGAQALLQLAPNLQPVQLSPTSNQRFIVLQEMANSPGVNYELDELMAETYQKNGGASISSSGSSSPISNSGKKSKARPWDSPSASSSGFSDSGYEDPEWSSTKSTESRDSSDPPAKKRCLNSTEERKLRKKEQNKNAATRYRMKKKMELEDIIGEEKELMDRHDTLKSEVVEITREIRYLKGLMGDLFRAKGLIRAK